MCGIVGSLQWQKPDSEQLIQRMAATLAHRGPDAEKVVSLGPLVLGHRRLSIIDVSPLSNQPMSDVTGRYWIVYNGELYNFKMLKTELMRLGHQFKTASDTEVILEAWKRYGIDCLQKFTGMFAFALWDKEEKMLFLARDRLGEKPLYYSIDSEHSNYNIIFASEMTPLCLHPKLEFKLNPRALSQFLSLNYTLTDACILQGIEKLPPAHFMVVKPGCKPEVRCYWDLDKHFKNKKQWTTKAEAVEQLQDLLKNSVQDQMISDVPLGAFLSGGLDSSSIVAAMKSSNIIKTFSIGFHEDSYNELTESRVVAKHLSVDHHSQFIDADRVKTLANIIQSTDEPFADSSMIPTYFLAEFSRQSVKVCLSGDGGDELFLGYETYAADKLYSGMQYLPKALVRMMSDAVEKYWPVSHDKVSFDYKLKQFLKGCQMDFQQAHYFWRVIFSEQEKSHLLRDDVKSDLLKHNPADSFIHYFSQVKDCHPLDQASYVDMKTWMADDILVKVDRLSMAHSLEVRAPFLNHHLVEFAASLPADWKLNLFQKKHLLKLSQTPYLPKSIIHRSKKGFNAPLSPWFLGNLQDFARESILDNIFLKQWFKQSALEQLWQEHRKQVKDHGLKLFGLMCLGLWLEKSQAIFSTRTSEQPVYGKYETLIR